MPINDAPAWATELALAYESGAHGQFILYGNVHDRLVVGNELAALDTYLESVLLATFPVVFAFDLGNGLSILRGGELIAKWSGGKSQELPRDPTAALLYVGHYLRYLGNLRTLTQAEPPPVAIILRGVDQLLPADGSGLEHGSLTSLLRAWAGASPFSELPFTSILLADNLNDVERLVAFDPLVARIKVSLPDSNAIQTALGQLKLKYPAAFSAAMDPASTATALVGVTLSALQSLVRKRAHVGQALGDADIAQIKKTLVESDTSELVEFIESRRTLDDYLGQDSLKQWLRDDLALWRSGDIHALPMGYLLCGPVGTGKTYLVECLAGEAGIPIVKLKNFRDRWVGSSEGNLEKIFRLIRALGRCMVFVDEADQTLGKRDSGSNDSGLSGRLYSMVAQEMSDTDNRGRIIWILASSRPDLIEVDLKRPGRVDVKVPLLPTTTAEESVTLLTTLARRFDMGFTEQQLQELIAIVPTLLTPGAAEALITKVYRQARTKNVAPFVALQACLQDYQSPVGADVLEFQMRIAIREATDITFVPPALRYLLNTNAP